MAHLVPESGPVKNKRVLAAVLRCPLPKTIRVENFSHKFSILFTPKLFPYVLNLHKEITCFFPLLATTGAASIAHMRRVSFEFCDFLYQNEDMLKICNGKTKGLAIQV